MIVDSLKRYDSSLYGLGGKEPPKNVTDALHRIDKRLEAIWNSDDKRWELYIVSQPGVSPGDDQLEWQNSAPTLGTNITPAIAVWLKKFDKSNGGFMDKDDMTREFKLGLFEGFDNQKKIKQKRADEWSYRMRDVVNFAQRAAFGTKQVVMPGPVVGEIGGKKIRMYPKNPYRSIISG